MKIREFDPTATEYETLVALHNAVWTDDRETVEGWRYWDENREKKFPYQRYVLEHEGQMVGYGSYSQSTWAYRPGKFRIYVHVHPDYQRQGLGTALYRHLLEALAPLEPTRLSSSTREDQAGAVHFLEKEGFEVVMRYPISELELAGFAPERFAGRVERALDGGIAIKSLAELRAEDPQWRQKSHALEWELLQDVPAPAPPQPVSLEDYEKRRLSHPAFTPEAFFIACDNGRWVGMSNLWRNLADETVIDTGLTGVVRSHRRRGIATALKVQALTYARKSGYGRVETGNEENNPMFELNRELGFRPKPAGLDFEKDLTGENEQATDEERNEDQRI